jgi:hypothetical protein
VRLAHLRAALLAGLALTAASGCTIGQPGAATDVVHTSARLNGVAYSNQEDVDVQYWFRYGTTTAYGSTTPERTHIPADSTDDRPHPVWEWLDGLAPDTTYHYQICTAPPRNGCVQSDQTFRTLPESPFVERSGESLTLASDPYRFTGLNIYNANSRGQCWYAMADGEALDDALDEIGAGKEAFRSWFFESLATTEGKRDWSAFDHTLGVARSRGVKVIATLANQWGDCEDGAFKDEDWYSGGYEDAYRAWVSEVVRRYRNDPAILAWQLMNEAEVNPSRDATVCSEDAAATLEAFAADMSALVRSIDPNHLVSLGTIGGGQCGTQGAEYADVHAVSTVDLCEYHDYQPGAIPGDEFNGLQVRIDQCADLGKPLIVGEAGVRPSDVGGTLEDRADAFDAKLAARAAAGVDGELVWAWSSLGSTLTDFDVGPDDPLLDVLAGY